MKKLVFLLISLVYLSNAYSNSITANTNNGNWMVSSSWNLNRVPANGDTVIIPTGKTIVIASNINLSSSTLTVLISGTLNFNGSGSKIAFNALSYILIAPSGSITSSGSPSETLKIGGITVYTGTEGTLIGPEFANNTTGNGFLPYIITLPVKFNSFTLSRSGKAILIQWSTSEELNSYNYEVERSTDGSNWQSISSLPAKGISNDISNYSYTDNSIGSAVLVYYRIKEIDKSGQVYFTSIKSIRNSENAQVDIQIAGSNGQVWIQFSQQIKGDVLVQFISTSGTVVGKQMLYQPVGQQMIRVSSSMKGNYFVLVSNGQDIKTSKQVSL